MTYEELLAENQRLRERIRELTHENARLKGRDSHVLCETEPPVYGARRALAEEARKLGFAILSAAMEDNIRMEMRSYDRFFPNQDFLPKGGFGNLVALPLQGLAKHNGNSLFVDEDFVPYKHQWTLLASAQKLSDTEMSTILYQHDSRLELSFSSDTKPWETPKPDRISFEDFDGPVKLVRANGLYVPLKSGSGKVIRHLKALASFPAICCST